MADEMETVETTEEAIEQPAEELQVEEASEEDSELAVEAQQLQAGGWAPVMDD